MLDLESIRDRFTRHDERLYREDCLALFEEIERLRLDLDGAKHREAMLFSSKMRKSRRLTRTRKSDPI